MQTIYAELPPELVAYIFQWGCIFSTSFCPALCQTSSWTRKIALPYLYSTIILKDSQTARLIWQNVIEHHIDSLNPGFPLRDHIKSVYVESNVYENTLDIFRNCDRLSRLAVEEHYFRSMVLLSSPVLPNADDGILNLAILCKPDIHLLVFSANEETIPPQLYVKLNSPLHHKVTHLRFGQMRSYSGYTDLTYFIRLTHLAMPYHCPQEQHLPDLLHIFDHLPMVSLVVVLSTDKLSEEERLDALKWVVDIRKSNYQVSAVLSKLGDVKMESEEEARHGLSIWDKADLFMQSLSLSTV